MPHHRFSIIVVLSALLASTTFAQTKPDYVRELQKNAAVSGKAEWGHWGDRPAKYSDWTYHSNRLVPIYTFGLTLERYTGENSSYRSEEILTEIYGELPEQTLDPNATYMDQTEVFFLQKKAIDAGKKNIILMIFDGMDWQTTYATTIFKNRTIPYTQGYGSGLSFLDYDACMKDRGDFVCSPHNSGTDSDVNSQTVSNIGGDRKGGYSAKYGGYHSWSKTNSDEYLLGKLKGLNHVVTDSAASATSMNSGIKTYNSAINVSPDG
ncbi:MAG: alkaline phosphatase, partial [Planctomycetota bacterium]